MVLCAFSHNGQHRAVGTHTSFSTVGRWAVIIFRGNTIALLYLPLTVKQERNSRLNCMFGGLLIYLYVILWNMFEYIMLNSLEYSATAEYWIRWDVFGKWSKVKWRHCRDISLERMRIATTAIREGSRNGKDLKQELPETN